MNWEQLQEAIKAAGDDTAKVALLYKQYAEGANTQITSLNGEAASHRKKAAERQLELDKYVGIDPTKVKEMQTAATKAEEDRLAAAGQFGKLKENLENQHEAALTASNDAGLKWKERFEKAVIGEKFTAAGAKGNAVAPNEISQLLGSRVKLNDEGIPVVNDVNGNPAFNKDDGKPETIEGLVAGFLSANPHHVKGTGGGSGSNNNSDNNSTGKTTIAKGDIGDNLEAVAKGETVVQQ